jgi:hypothetical protein
MKIGYKEIWVFGSEEHDFAIVWRELIQRLVQLYGARAVQSSAERIVIPFWVGQMPLLVERGTFLFLNKTFVLGFRIKAPDIKPDQLSLWDVSLQSLFDETINEIGDQVPCSMKLIGYCNELSSAAYGDVTFAPEQ